MRGTRRRPLPSFFLSRLIFCFCHMDGKRSQEALCYNLERYHGVDDSALFLRAVEAEKKGVNITVNLSVGS